MNSSIGKIITVASLASVLLIAPISATAYTRTVTDMNVAVLASHSPFASFSPFPTPNASAIKSTLQGDRLAICQKYYNTIVSESDKAVAQANVMYQDLTNAAVATEAYYKTESAITHKTLPNYNTLAAAVQTTGQAVPPLIAKAQNDINAFTCTSTNPNQQLQQFGTDVAALVKALVAYQTAVLNLMAGVESVFPVPSPTP